MFGYLLFEALSFNDFCNAAKTNDGSLLRSMLIVRIAGSLGIFLGWALGAPLSAALNPDQSSRLIIALCFVVVIVAASLVFTDKAIGTLGTIAHMRARQEAAEPRLDKTRLIPLFATEHDLSKREAEVLKYLLQGAPCNTLPRNCSSPSPPSAPMLTRYTRKPRPGIAWSSSTASSSSAPSNRKLNRAKESTVRTHVHSICRKCGVHSRMEPMGAFDECWMEGAPKTNSGRARLNRQHPAAHLLFDMPILLPVIPVNFRLVVGFDCLAAESHRVSSHRRLGQALGQIRKLFRNREPAVSFLSQGQKRVGFKALKPPLPDQAARWNYEIPRPRLGPSVPKRLRNPRSLFDAHS